MVSMALWLNLRNVPLEEEEETLKISTRTAAAKLPRLKKEKKSGDKVYKC